MRVLVTGCNGQVGHSLVQRLKDNVELLAVDRAKLDITDSDAVFETVQNFKPDYIINAAAHTAVDKAEEEVDLSYVINRDGSAYLAQAANKLGSIILHISTDYVFPGNKDGLYEENDETGPLGIYGESKLAGEEEVIKANAKHIILRTSWVFGEFGNNFVKTMLRVGKSRDAMSVVGDQFGGPTYAGDIADALVAIINQLEANKEAPNQFGVYHYSGLPHVSWCEFAKCVFEKAEANDVLSAPVLTSITTDMYPTPAKRPINSKMSTTKISKVFGIEASDWRLALNDIKKYTD